MFRLDASNSEIKFRLDLPNSETKFRIYYQIQISETKFWLGFKKE